MFWKTKKVVEKYTTDIFGKNVTFTNFTELAQILEKASALQDQNRRDYNLLFERQELILDHLKLKYVPETKEPSKLVKKMGDNSFFDNLKHGAIVNVPNAGVSMPMPMSVPMSGGGGSCSTSCPTPTKPKKKRGRPKKK